MRTATSLLATIILIAGCRPSGGDPGAANPVEQVMEVERAFARTMAERDFQAFTSFLSDEAVFFTGETPLRGREKVAAWWKRFYDSTDAPFSWEPERVEVLGSGTLALSTGPVRNRGGKLIGTFTSVWRQEEPGRWRIVFDKGNPACE